MAQKQTELDSFLEGGKIALYRHGDKNRPSPFMCLFKKAAMGITMMSTVGCAAIDHLQYGTTASNFDDMQDIVETTMPENNTIHVLSLTRYAPYKQAPETEENAIRFHQDVNLDTGAHIPAEQAIKKGYETFRNSMPIALSMLNDISNQKECLVIPLDHRKVPDVINTLLPLGVNKYVPAFSDISRHAVNNFTNYHEAWHCTFFANLDHYKKLHNIPTKEEDPSWTRLHYGAHIGEVLSDTAALAEIVYNGITSDKETMEVFQHLRNLALTQSHYSFSEAATPFVSYYTAPAMEAMQEFILDKGIKEFRAMPVEEVAQVISRIAQENTLSYEHFGGLWNYSKSPLEIADKMRDAQDQTQPKIHGLDKVIEGYKARTQHSLAYAEQKLKDPGFNLMRRLGFD